MKNHKKRTFRSTKDAFDDYVRFQTHAINFFPGRLSQSFDTTTKYVSNQTFWAGLEIYSRSSTICVRKYCRLVKVMNEITQQMSSALKSLFSIPKGLEITL